MLEISTLLLAKLNEKGIEYLHWKGNSHVRDGFNGIGDADIFTPVGNKVEISQVLAACGFVRFETQNYLKRSDIEDWLGMDTASGILVHVHLHFNMIYGKNILNEYKVAIPQLCMEECIIIDGIKCQNPILEYLIFLHKIVSGSCKSQKKIQKNIEYFKKYMNNYDVDRILTKCGFGATESCYLKETMRKGIIEKRSYKKVSSILCKIVETDVSKFSLPSIKKRISHFATAHTNLFFRKKTCCKRGVSIAFLGQDGAGKSTLTNSLEKWGSWKLEIKRVYLGNGEHYFSWRKNLSTKIKKISILTPIRVLLTVQDFANLAKHTYKEIQKAQKYVGKGVIVMFDRYPQIVYPGINDGPKINAIYTNKVNNRFLRRIFLHYAKTEEYYLSKATAINPDIIFKLTLPPEESIRRKPFEDIALVTRKHNIIKSLQFPQSLTKDIDATQNFEDELIEIKGVIWDTIKRLNKNGN